MKKLSRTAIEYVLCKGACEAGIVTRETLEGGPPSADISYVMPTAKSAVSFAVPLDQSLIPPYLSKRDRVSHEKDYIQANVIANGIAVQLALYLRLKGYPSVPVNANDVYRDGAPELTVDMYPDISHRYLAVRSGVGHFGFSGNVIHKDFGASVILGAVVTEAELVATDSLPEEENYCDGCKLCMASCLSGLMEPKEETHVTLGGIEFTYAKRRRHYRCALVCGGFTGLHPSGKWSTWSPGRFDIPEEDEAFLPVMEHAFNAWGQWPEIGGGSHNVISDKKIALTCGNCGLVCCPDKEERKERYKMLTKNGVVVQNPDGSLKAVSPKEAKKHFAAMDLNLRALYERI